MSLESRRITTLTLQFVVELVEVILRLRHLRDLVAGAVVHDDVVQPFCKKIMHSTVGLLRRPNSIKT